MCRSKRCGQQCLQPFFLKKCRFFSDPFHHRSTTHFDETSHVLLYCFDGAFLHVVRPALGPITLSPAEIKSSSFLPTLSSESRMLLNDVASAQSRGLKNTQPIKNIYDLGPIVAQIDIAVAQIKFVTFENAIVNNWISWISVPGQDLAGHLFRLFWASPVFVNFYSERVVLFLAARDIKIEFVCAGMVFAKSRTRKESWEATGDGGKLVTRIVCLQNV